jgi:hypothetical protein
MKNILFQDTIEMTKIIEPAIFPMFEVKENYHYTARSADVVAFLTAMQLWQQFQ